MRERRLVLVLLLIVTLGLSLAIQAEDIPETPYDESEALPYEGTPLFSIAVPQASARMSSAEFRSDAPFPHGSLRKRRQRPREERSKSHCLVISRAILNHSLRC